jgi:hypothetical protein
MGLIRANLFSEKINRAGVTWPLAGPARQF